MTHTLPPPIHAIIFDMDGLLLDSEVYWARARTDYCASVGCQWREEDELDVKGYNSPEWAAQIRRRCHLEAQPDDITAAVEARMRDLYVEHLPLLPGAEAAVTRLARTYPLAIASSSPPSLIEFAMHRAGLLACFKVVVSADTVGKGKPAPDVFLVAAERLGYPPNAIAVFEDSTAGIKAARAAGMFVIAVPNPHYPPDPDTLEQSDIQLSSLEDFDPAMLARPETFP
jgi:HAD superfamily hydrolase (TIGR01509 family)